MPLIMIAKSLTITKMLLLLLCAAFATDSLTAQRKKGKEDEGGGELKILKNLPMFFVDDQAFPAYLKTIYKVDATRLAVRLINKEQRVAKQTVRVPEELVRAVYNALIAVRTSDYAAIDTITTNYYVRTFPVPSVESVVLLFEHDSPIADPVKKRHDSTGSPGINRIIREYNLVMTKMVYLDEERAGLVLNSREPINVSALMHRLYMEEGVGCIEEQSPYGDGNDIQMERTATGWDVTYSVRFGNCVNQCQKIHDWRFSVSETGAVTYNGSTGHVIPPWVNPPAIAKKYPDKLK
jgi:hypothetical protein